ncbi:MAG: hypothetical protein AAF236_12360, partial [Verrucomicrobiota bacterium]
TGMGTDWTRYERFGYSSENTVEIFQGARVSYEGAGAPQPTAGMQPGAPYTINGDKSVSVNAPDPIDDFGQFATGTYQTALELGLRLGVFACSDHIAQHTSYGGVFCEEFTREGIIEAFDSRRTIAATDRIYLNFTANGSPLGSEITSTGPVRLWFRVEGTAPLSRVTIVRNEENWKTYESLESQQLEMTVDDEAPQAEQRYYVRVEQADGNMAWSSPVWVSPVSPTSATD